MQAEGRSSDCVLKPVRIVPDATRTNGAVVLCEVMMPDGKTPHPSNKRATILDDEGAWFGFEQEYFFYKNGRPLGFPDAGYPAPQGPYYTGVGYKNVGDVARKIVEEHLDICLAAGINHEGINAEVAKGQWEFQIFGKGSKRAADEMWLARYFMRAPDREVRHRHRVSLQAARRHRLERLGHALPTSRPPTCARSAARTISKQLMAAFDDSPRRPHRGLRSRQPHAPDRQARDRVDPHIQLRRR